MALVKDIERDDGVVIRYWRLTSWQTDLVAGVVWVILGGYRDEDARRAGKKPVEERPVTMALGDADPETVSRAMLYEFIKTYVSDARAHVGLGPEFAGASDA